MERVFGVSALRFWVLDACFQVCVAELFQTTKSPRHEGGRRLLPQRHDVTTRDNGETAAKCIRRLQVSDFLAPYLYRAEKWILSTIDFLGGDCRVLDCRFLLHYLAGNRRLGTEPISRADS